MEGREQDQNESSHFPKACDPVSNEYETCEYQFDDERRQHY
jgi:hypothetical protein